MKVILAYDGETCSAAAIADLGQAGLPAGTSVDVVSVADVYLPVESGTATPAGFEVPASVTRAHDEGRAALARARAVAEAGARLVREGHPEWTAQAFAHADSPAWALLQQAAHSQADLIVLGCHNYGAMHRFLLGSVSQKVLHEATCSVRIARPAAGGKPPRLLVAIDGSPASLAAARQVAARHWPAGTTALVATVADQQFNSLAASVDDDAAGDQALRLAARVAAELTAAGVPAEAQVPVGDPKRVLAELAEAQGITCLFVGARGGRLRSAGTLGSVAATLAARAPTSVEVIRVPGA